MTKSETLGLIEQKIEKALAPNRLEVIDESEQHRGHGGYIAGQLTHVKIVLEAETLRGRSRLEQQRAVYAALGELVGAPLHAISIKVL